MKKTFYIKLLTIIFVVAYVVSCVPNSDNIARQRFIVANKTEKYLAGKIVVDWNIKKLKDSIDFYLLPNESVINPVFEFKYSKSKSEFYWTDNGCDVTFFCYNLSDTAVLIRKQSKIESIITNDSYWNIEATGYTHEYKTTINENTLSLFEKNYKLLDDFSDYYLKKK